MAKGTTMRDWLEGETALWVSRGIVAAVFLLYGASKIPLTETLARSIHNYHLVPIAAENLLAMILPWVEVAAGLAILTRKWMPGGTVVIGGLLVVFLAAIASAMARGLDIDCGCFTLSADSPTSGTLVRTFIQDVILLGLSAHIWWRLRHMQSAANGAS